MNKFIPITSATYIKWANSLKDTTLKLTQEEIDHLKRPLCIQRNWTCIYKLSHKENSKPINLLYKARITLIPNPEKDITSKENYTQISLMKYMQKLFKYF